MIQSAACGAALGIGATASAWVWPIVVDDPPVQDPIVLPAIVHELGSIGFPPDELITTVWLGDTTQTACFDGSDNQFIPNQLVEITNLTSLSWYNLHYVADPETVITNFDGFIGNPPPIGPDFEEAFKIDNVGINRPLVSESLIPNLIFEPGETWAFILQDWSHLGGAPPPNSADFDSIGIAGNSLGWPPSTGSIIAVIPEPALLGLLTLGAGGLLAWRRRRFC